MIKGIFNDADLNQQMVMVSNKNERFYDTNKKSRRSIPEKYLIEYKQDSSQEE